MQIVRLWAIMYRGLDSKYYAYVPDLGVARCISEKILQRALNDREHSPRGLFDVFRDDILSGKTILPVDGNIAKLKFTQYARVKGLDPEQAYLCLSRIEFMVSPRSDKQQGESDEETSMGTSS